MAIIQEEEQSIVESYEEHWMWGDVNWWTCPICSGDLVRTENAIICSNAECLNAVFYKTCPPSLENLVEHILEFKTGHS